MTSYCFGYSLYLSLGCPDAGYHTDKSQNSNSTILNSVQSKLNHGPWSIYCDVESLQASFLFND